MRSQHHLLLFVLLFGYVLGYFTLDGPACQKMCVLEGHSDLSCQQECWWPQMHLEAERLCHQACRIRGVSDDSQCMQLCFSTPVRDILPHNQANVGFVTNAVSNGPSNMFGRVKNHYAEIRVGSGKKISVEKHSQILFPGPGLRPEELATPDWSSQECSCSDPVGPTRIEVGLIDGSAADVRGREKIAIEGYMCPTLGCFYEKQIPPQANLRYNIPIRVEWDITIPPKSSSSSAFGPGAFWSLIKSQSGGTKHYSKLMTFRKKGNPQYSGPIMAGDVAFRADLDGNALTKQITVKKTVPPMFSRWFGSLSETRTVQQEDINFYIGGSCGEPGQGVLGGPSGSFNVDKHVTVKSACSQRRRGAFSFIPCPSTEQRCVRQRFSYTIIDPLSVVLEGTSIN